MRTSFLILLTALFSALCHLSLGQTQESFVHCSGNFEVFIEKISETVVGDTIIKEYQDHVFLNNPIDSTFKYYFFNDSVFIQYNNEFYMIGDNNGQVGDVWNPIRFEPISYTDTTENCPLLMNLEVVSVEDIMIDGVPTKYFTLEDMDGFSWPGAYYRFLSGVGATLGGPYYNFNIYMDCGIFDAPHWVFLSYQRGGFIYVEDTCSTVSVEDHAQLLSNEISIFPNPSSSAITVSFDGADKRINSLRISDLYGKEVYEETGLSSRSVEHCTVNITNLQTGVYLLEVLTADNRLVSKIIKQ